MFALVASATEIERKHLKRTQTRALREWERVKESGVAVNGVVADTVRMCVCVCTVYVPVYKRVCVFNYGGLCVCASASNTLISALVGLNKQYTDTRALSSIWWIP